MTETESAAPRLAGLGGKAWARAIPARPSRRAAQRGMAAGELGMHMLQRASNQRDLAAVEQSACGMRLLELDLVAGGQSECNIGIPAQERDQPPVSRAVGIRMLADVSRQPIL
jgi:hypothetical protein